MKSSHERNEVFYVDKKIVAFIFNLPASLLLLSPLFIPLNFSFFSNKIKPSIRRYAQERDDRPAYKEKRLFRPLEAQNDAFATLVTLYASSLDEHMNLNFTPLMVPPPPEVIALVKYTG